MHDAPRHAYLEPDVKGSLITSLEASSLLSNVCPSGQLQKAESVPARSQVRKIMIALRSWNNITRTIRRTIHSVLTYQKMLRIVTVPVEAGRRLHGPPGVANAKRIALYEAQME